MVNCLKYIFMYVIKSADLHNSTNLVTVFTKYNLIFYRYVLEFKTKIIYYICAKYQQINYLL